MIRGFIPDSLLVERTRRDAALGLPAHFWMRRVHANIPVCANSEVTGICGAAPAP